MKFVKLSPECYIPEHYVRESFTATNLLLSVLPERMTSYLLGFPVFSIGTLTPKCISMLSAEEQIVNTIEKTIQKNKESINSRIYFGKVGNNSEGGSYLNNVYTEVDHYNHDDVMILFIGGFYFIFNYPEFNNMITTKINPYTRDSIGISYITNMFYLVASKENLKKEVRKRGLNVELSGTMYENYEEVFEKILTNDSQDDVYINGNHNALKEVFWTYMFH
jgi:hypothetical protein